MRRLLLLLAVALAGVGSLCGQAIRTPRKVMALGDAAAADSLDLYGILSDNAPGDFPVAGVPYTTVVGRGGKFVAGVGGFVKVLAGWDIGHPMDNADEFITSQIPVGDPEGDGARFNFSARQTHLYINFVGLPGTSNQIGAFVGANLLSDDYVPVVQYAYLKYRGIKAGYDNTLFSDPACGAPAIDYEGPSSNTCSPVGGLSYGWQRGPWSLGGGIELPQTSFTVTAGKTRSVNQRVPDIPLAARYSWGGGNSWVRLSAILRNMAWRDIPAARNHNAFGYGFQVSGAESFLDCLTLYWQGVWGRGIGSMLQDCQDEGLDLTPAADGTSLRPVMLWGGFLSLQWDISNRFSTSATYSQVRTYAPEFTGGDIPWGDLYRYAQYFSATIFFEATSWLEAGVEYDWGRRVNYDGMAGADNRIQASLQFTF